MKRLQRAMKSLFSVSDEKAGTPLAHWELIASRMRGRDSSVPMSSQVGLETWEAVDEKLWKEFMAERELKVLRRKGTETPGSSPYNKFYPSEGYFACRACGLPLYSAGSKFDSGTGWPSFGEHLEGNIVTKDDYSLRVRRVELCCRRCSSHLGHVFAEENNQRNRPQETFRERQCINGVCLWYIKDRLPSGVNSHATALPH